MHEVHIVRELVTTVEKEATAQGAKRVRSLRLRYNPLVSHDAEHVRFCFDVVKKESRLLQEANLVLDRVPGLVRCEGCQRQFELSELPNVCPHCGSIQLTPVNPTHLVLESFEIER